MQIVFIFIADLAIDQFVSGFLYFQLHMHGSGVEGASVWLGS